MAQDSSAIATLPVQQDSSSLLGLSGSGVPTTTVPKEPYLTNPLSDGRCEVQTDICLGTNNWLPTLSPTTCLELLPQLTKAQINHEIEYNLSLGIDIGARQNTKYEKRTELLRHKLENDTTSLIDKYLGDLSKYDLLIHSFSELLAKAEEAITELTAEKQRKTDSSTPAAQTSQQLVTDSNLPALSPPVRTLSVTFKDIDWQDVCKGAVFQRIGSRLVDYFGAVDYGYGLTIHVAKEYPENEVIDQIILAIATELDDPTFNKDNVTCLVTKYLNGKFHIPYHSDDENIIGDIVTAIFGATRDLSFRSKAGPAVQTSHTLGNGTVYAMSRESQDFWEHGILPEPNDTGCRVSLTFRRIAKASSATPSIPPIHEPSKPANDPQPRTNERILFLTDSMLHDIPSHLLPSHVHCIKRKMYQLNDILDHEQYFPGTKYVIISAGINDLSRYDHRYYSLSRDLTSKLELLCKKYPQTTFIYNSLVLTRFEWLNREVHHFNRFMFDFSRRHCNFWFFDSHHICSKLSERRHLILNPSGNGIHLAFLPRGEITSCLAICVRELTERRTAVCKYWPLRREYASLLGRN